MAELERRKGTCERPKKVFLAAVVFAALTSSLSLICGVSVSRELGNLPDDFLLNVQAGVLGSTFLAYQQSYGFFDDIPDESWKLMQQRAQKSLSFFNDNPGLPETIDENADEGYLNNLQVSGRFRRPFSYSSSIRLTITFSCLLAARVYLPSSKSCGSAGKRAQVDLRP